MPRGPADPVTCHVVTGLAGRGTTAFLRVVLSRPSETQTVTHWNQRFTGTISRMTSTSPGISCWHTSCDVLSLWGPGTGSEGLSSCAHSPGGQGRPEGCALSRWSLWAGIPEALHTSP